jgi:tetratricopeptide (TPR) repeat protein
MTFLAQPWAAAGDDPPKTARYYRQRAAEAYKAKDYPSAIENFKKAAEIIPDHPTLLYNLACMYALAGRKNEALASLSQVADMGLILPAQKDTDLDAIKDTPEFNLIIKHMEASRAPVIRSSNAFVIHERGLITEGLAYDPVEETAKFVALTVQGHPDFCQFFGSFITHLSVFLEDFIYILYNGLFVITVFNNRSKT